MSLTYKERYSLEVERKEEMQQSRNAHVKKGWLACIKQSKHKFVLGWHIMSLK